MTDRAKYYPCIINSQTGKINKIVASAMYRDQAEAHLKASYYDLWLNCEALPVREDDSNLCQAVSDHLPLWQCAKCDRMTVGVKPSTSYCRLCRMDVFTAHLSLAGENWGENNLPTLMLLLDCLAGMDNLVDVDLAVAEGEAYVLTLQFQPVGPSKLTFEENYAILLHFSDCEWHESLPETLVITWNI